MNMDIYGEVINGEDTYYTIAKNLLDTGKCIIGWTDQEYDHRDIMFVYKPTYLGGTLQRGLRPYYLYVSIMSFSCMGFLIEKNTDNRKDNGYIMEKLQLHNNHCDRAICDLINGVIEQLDLLRLEDGKK